MPSAYLDTCLVIGLAKEDLRRVEQAALDELTNMWGDGRLKLVTSDVTHEEILHVPEGVRTRHDATLERLATIPTVAEAIPRVVTNRPGSRIVGPLPHPDMAELRTLLRDDADARHLFQAIQGDVDFFVTDDQRSIVSKAAEIEARHSIKLRLPSALVAELGG
jgi:predicted nucleic acid-binding protein